MGLMKQVVIFKKIIIIAAVLDGDYVNADAQDGSCYPDELNNANFSTP
jgi:hypothetical protein